MAFSFDLGLAISAERYGAISAGPEQWYLTLNMPVIFIAIFIEPLAKWEHGRLSVARTIHNSTASVVPCAVGFPRLRGRPPFGSTIMSVLLSS